MTQKVLLTLCGTQLGQDREDVGPIKTVSQGDYYKKNDSHYVIYEEQLEGSEGVLKNRLKFNADTLELCRTGAVNVRMVFQENKKNLTNYNTPFGQILMGIDTKKIQINEWEGHITVEVDYALDINDEFLSDCHMTIDINEAPAPDPI